MIRRRAAGGALTGIPLNVALLSGFPLTGVKLGENEGVSAGQAVWKDDANASLKDDATASFKDQ